MSARTRETLADVISQLRLLLAKLERHAHADSRALPQAILDALADLGPLSTNGVTRLLHRRRCDVLATLNLMHAAKQIARCGGKWNCDHAE